VNHRLYRCRQNRVFAGVCGGVAEFFGLNPTHVRIMWLISACFGGFSIVLYVGLALMIPIEPLTTDHPGLPATHSEPQAA
jgi:phage shock protein C